jgi:hypothetical protein
MRGSDSIARPNCASASCLAAPRDGDLQRLPVVPAGLIEIARIR